MEEKEIELIDYIKVVKKRFWFIVLTTAVFFLASLAYTLYQAKNEKPLYKSQAILKVGKVANNYLDADINVIGQVNNLSFLAAATKDIAWRIKPGSPNALLAAFSINSYDPRLSGEKPLPAQLAAVRPDTHLILLTAVWSDPGDAQAIIEAVGLEIIKSHQAKFDLFLANYQNYLAELKKHLASIELEISRMKKTQRELENDGGLKAPEVILLQANLEEREQSFLERQKEIRNQEVALSEFNSENTSFLSPPSPGVRTRTLAKDKNVVLATLAGLFLSVLLAFFLEYLAANKERLK